MDGSIARLRSAVHKPGQSWCCMTFPPVLCATLNSSWTRQPSWASACGRILHRSAYLFAMGGSFDRSPIFSRQRARFDWGAERMSNGSMGDSAWITLKKERLFETERHIAEAKALIARQRAVLERTGPLGPPS